MPEKNKISRNKHNDVTINLKKSSIAEFTKRPLPSEEEMDAFEEKVEKEIYQGDFNEEDFFDDENDEEIEESLNEIYQDDDGHIADVKKMQKTKRHGFLFRFFSFLFFLSLISFAVYYAYNFIYLDSGSDATALQFSIEGQPEVVSGEEFFYILKYKNSNNVAINNLEINLNFPNNFVFLDSFPISQNKTNNFWKIDSLSPHSEGTIKIKGKLLGEEGSSGVISATIEYMPENFQSEFKKEATFVSSIKDIGLNIDFDYISSVLVGDKNEISLAFNAREKNFINNFRLSIEPEDNLEIIGINNKKEDVADFEELRSGVWEINEVSENMKFLPIDFKINEKKENKQKITLVFEQLAGDKYYTFLKKEIEFEIMKSNLNLTLIINGSSNDQGINLDDTLNYSIVYKNKGETEMKDVVIMAVLKSDFLDWTSLDDKNNGIEKGNTISWSKNEIKDLESIQPNEEGTIDFSMKLLALGDFDRDKNYEVVSYAQFNIGENEDNSEDDEEKDEKEAELLLDNKDNKSNTIINKINSDLKLKESLRYFNNDNIPVGTGPHPPRVGEKTTYKVYWDLENNLHELKKLKLSLILPDYVFWDKHDRTTVGSLEFNDETHELIWDIGRLPISVFEAKAEFSIGIEPKEEDKNKILVLLPGTKVSAEDAETKAILELKTKAKTTKLEDDDIAQGDGIVN